MLFINANAIIGQRTQQFTRYGIDHRWLCSTRHKTREEEEGVLGQLQAIYMHATIYCGKLTGAFVSYPESTSPSVVDFGGWGLGWTYYEHIELIWWKDAILIAVNYKNSLGIPDWEDRNEEDNTWNILPEPQALLLNCWWFTAMKTEIIFILDITDTWLIFSITLSTVATPLDLLKHNCWMQGAIVVWGLRINSTLDNSHTIIPTW